MEWIAGLYAIGGSLIGAGVSYLVIRYQFRMTVLSKNRQDWINELRNLLSEFHSILHCVIADVTHDIELRNFDERVKASMRSLAILCKVRFMLNPQENDHSQLLSLMRKMNQTVTLSQDEVAKEFFNSNKEFIPLAQSILKREWERVKKGN